MPYPDTPSVRFPPIADIGHAYEIVGKLERRTPLRERLLSILIIVALAALAIGVAYWSVLDDISQ